MNDEKKIKSGYHNLTPKIYKKLLPLDKLNFQEQYAVFMGKAQLVEMGLKSVLINKYSYKENQVERLTLGQTIYELEKKRFGFRTP